MSKFKVGTILKRYFSFEVMGDQYLVWKATESYVSLFSDKYVVVHHVIMHEQEEMFFKFADPNSEISPSLDLLLENQRHFNSCFDATVTPMDQLNALIPQKGIMESFANTDAINNSKEPIDSAHNIKMIDKYFPSTGDLEYNRLREITLQAYRHYIDKPHYKITNLFLYPALKNELLERQNSLDSFPRSFMELLAFAYRVNVVAIRNLILPSLIKWIREHVEKEY